MIGFDGFKRGKGKAEETANGVATVTGVVVKGIGSIINGKKYEKSFTEEKGYGGIFIKGLTLEAEPFVSSRTYDRFDVKDKEKREQTYGPMVGFTVAQAGIEQENIKGFGIGAEAKSSACYCRVRCSCGKWKLTYRS